jgi:uncharacterized phage protein (TIGR01671 family)
MKRQRKYRAWNGEKMIFRGLHDKNWYTEHYAGKFVQPAHQDDIHYLKVMNFTGFKDFDEKKIYEGDILEYVCTLDSTKKRRKVVSFDNEVGAWYLGGDMLSTVLFIQNNDEWKKSKNWNINQNQYTRIIGNIFENPDL